MPNTFIGKAKKEKNHVETNNKGSCLMRLLVLEKIRIIAKIRISQISPKNHTNEMKKPKIRISHKIALAKYTYNCIS